MALENNILVPTPAHWGWGGDEVETSPGLLPERPSRSPRRVPRAFHTPSKCLLPVPTDQTSLCPSSQASSRESDSCGSRR